MSQYRPRGKENVNYNGGLCLRDDGRTVIHCRDHSLRYFYRAVMEAHLGRHLTSDEIVHHINGDSSDDRLENLELTTRSAHARHHHAGAIRTPDALLDEALNLRESGLTYEQIAREQGISQMSAWNRVKRAKERHAIAA